jgi:hypothetical protein
MNHSLVRGEGGVKRLLDTGTVRVFRQKIYTREECHRFLSGVHFLTGSHCKLHPNTEGNKWIRELSLTMSSVTTLMTSHNTEGHYEEASELTFPSLVLRLGKYP